MFFLDYENIYKKKLDAYLNAIKQIHFVGKLKKKTDNKGNCYSR